MYPINLYFEVHMYVLSYFLISEWNGGKIRVCAELQTALRTLYLRDFLSCRNFSLCLFIVFP